MAPTTVLFIHGLWMTPLCWEGWIDRYHARGFEVIAPPWPRMEVGIAGLRRDPERLAGLGIAEIALHYERIVRALPRPPILVGHSFGGTFVQLLLDRGLGSAGVAVDSSTVRGVLSLPLTTLRATLPVLGNPFNVRRALALTPAQFHYAFTNTLTRTESDAVYQRYAVPGPCRVLFQAALANLNPHAATRVDFRNGARAPLLFIAGGKDVLIPPAVNRENARRWARSGAVTDYQEFPERTHYTLGQDGWEEVADYALEWAVRHAAARAARTEAPARAAAARQPAATGALAAGAALRAGDGAGREAHGPDRG